MNPEVFLTGVRTLMPEVLLVLRKFEPDIGTRAYGAWSNGP